MFMRFAIFSHKQNSVVTNHDYSKHDLLDLLLNTFIYLLPVRSSTQSMAVRFRAGSNGEHEIYYKLELGSTQVSGPADGRFFGGCRIIGHGNLHHMNTEIHGRVSLALGIM